MIILRDVPFEKRAQFLHDSLSLYPDSSEFGEALRTHAIDVSDGLRAYHSLLKAIYADVACVEGTDDDKRYQELVASMAFLYGVFASGTLVAERDWYSVRIDKATLKQVYKKGGFAKR